MKILIQGAGIAGLTLAHLLRQQGLECLVVEKKKDMKKSGAGITLAGNALFHLAKFLDLNSLSQQAQVLQSLTILDQNGKVLSVVPGQIEGQSHPGIAVNRGVLHNHLLKELTAEVIRWGVSIEKVSEQSAGVGVHLSDGTYDVFDLVVGADGLYSAVRAYVESAPIQYSGYTCWRGVVAHRLKRPSEGFEMWGRGKRMGYVQIDPEHVYFYMTLNATRQSSARKTADQSVPFLKNQFQDFKGEVPLLLEKLGEETVLIHNDLEEVRLKQWFRQRIVLIGDAAHAMTPNLGQGAAMGIEDAACLAECLQRLPVNDALPEFQRRRGERVRWIQDQSRLMGKMGQIKSAPLAWLRNQALLWTPASTMQKNIKKMIQPQEDVS